MRRPVLLAMTTALLVVVTVALLSGVWLAADDPAPGVTQAVDLAAGPVDPDDEAGGEKVDEEKGGPPPWARAHGHAGKAKPGLERWKALSDAQKADLMKRLVAEHEAGMKAFAACRAEGRDDCVKPMPPGLAKRDLG